jgi:hypothetical protein
VFTNKTKAARINDTVEFFPSKTTIPYLTPKDVAIQASQDLIRVLPQQKPPTPFAAHIGHNQLEAIKQIADIFNSHISTHEPAGTSKTPHKTVSTLPRVLKPRKQPLPRVLPIQTQPPTHWYPTRHVISQTQDEAYHVTQLPPIDDLSHIQQWANVIIDPDTRAWMEYRHLIKSPKYCQAW